jgi:hypothetical protein
MEHVMQTQERISLSTLHLHNLHMPHVGFWNAFGSIPHNSILSNTMVMGIPLTCAELVKNVYTNNGCKVTRTGAGTSFIQWQTSII